MIGCDGSRYSHCSIAPVDAFSTTPSRLNAQQSYATETKKLAGRRLSAPILQPISVTFPPKPIAPISSVLTVAITDASTSRQPRIRDSHRRASGTAAPWRVCIPTFDRRRRRHRPRPGCSPCLAPARPRAGCTSARRRGCDRRDRDAAVQPATRTARSCSRSRRPSGSA